MFMLCAGMGKVHLAMRTNGIETLSLMQMSVLLKKVNMESIGKKKTSCTVIARFMYASVNVKIA